MVHLKFICFSENAKHYSKNLSNSRRSLQFSRSRSPSKCSSVGIKPRGRHESHSSRNSRLNRSPSSKDSPVSKKKIDVSSSNDEHENKQKKKSHKEKEPGSAGNGDLRRPSTPPFRPSIHLSSRSKSKTEKKSKRASDKSDSQTEQEKPKSEPFSDNEDKPSSEPEEGEFRSNGNGPEVSSRNTAAVAEARSKMATSEPYEECDIMMSDQSDIEADMLKSEERLADVHRGDSETPVQVSKNDERPLCDVDRGGTETEMGDYSDIFDSLKKRSSDFKSVQSFDCAKKSNISVSNLTAGHFLEFSGDDGGENRPHSSQVATALLQQNISPSHLLSASFQQQVQLEYVDPATILKTGKGVCDQKRSRIIEKEEPSDCGAESPSRALDDFLSAARAKASIDSGTLDRLIPAAAVSALCSSSSLSSNEVRREEEQHETDNDDMDSDDTMRRKMNAMENELQLEDISSPEQSFSDAESQSQTIVNAEMAQRDQADAHADVANKEKIDEERTLPLMNVDVRTPPMTPSTESSRPPLPVATAPPETPAWLESLPSRHFGSLAHKSPTSVSTPIVIPMQPLFPPPTPHTTSPAKTYTTHLKNDDSSSVSASKVWHAQVESNVKSPSTKLNIERERRTDQHQTAQSQRRSGSISLKIIPLEIASGTEPRDPRNDIATGLFEVSLKRLMYHLPPKSPCEDTSRSQITESQSILEDWKRRGIVKPKVNRSENEENSTSSPANLQRVNELLNKFNVSSIFDQDSQRLAVLDPDVAGSAVSPASIVSQRSYDFSYPSPTPWGSSSPIFGPSSSSTLNIDIPSPSYNLKKEPLQGILKSPISSSSMKSDDPRLKGKAPPPFPPLNVLGGNATSAANSFCDTVPKPETIRVSDKYQRKPAASSGKLNKLSIKTDEYLTGSGSALNSASIPSPVSSVSSCSSCGNHVDGMKSPAVRKSSSNNAWLISAASLKANAISSAPVAPSVSSTLPTSKNVNIQIEDKTADCENKPCNSAAIENIKSNVSTNTTTTSSNGEMGANSDKLKQLNSKEMHEDVCSTVNNSASCTTPAPISVKIEPNDEGCFDEKDESSIVTCTLTTMKTDSAVCSKTDHSDNTVSCSKVDASSASPSMTTATAITSNSQINVNAIAESQLTSFKPHTDDVASSISTASAITNTNTVLSITAASNITSISNSNTCCVIETSSSDICEASKAKKQQSKDVEKGGPVAAAKDQENTTESSALEIVKNGTENSMMAATSKTSTGKGLVAVEKSKNEKSVSSAASTAGTTQTEKQKKSLALTPSRPQELSQSVVEKACKKEKEREKERKINAPVSKSESVIGSVKKIVHPIVKETAPKCSDVDIFVGSSKPKLKHKFSKKHQNDNSQSAPSILCDKIETKLSPIDKNLACNSLDRGEESSDNEAEKKTLEKLMGSSQNKTASASKEIESHSKVNEEISPKNVNKTAPSVNTANAHKSEVNAVQKVINKHHKKKKEKDGKVVIKQENCEVKTLKHAQNVLQNVNKSMLATNDLNISTDETVIKTNQKELSSPNRKEKAPKIKEEALTSPVFEHEPLEKQSLIIESQSLVSHQVMEPLKVEIDEALANKSDQSVSCAQLSQHHNSSDSDSPLSSFSKSKSAPVSAEKVGGHSPSSTPSSGQHKKKRPYVEIVVDESEEQENIDYVQNQRSRQPGIDICIRKVKTESLRIAFEDEEQTPIPLKKAKVSPKKQSLEGSKEKVLSSKKHPKVAKSPVADDYRSSEETSERSTTPRSVVSSTSMSAIINDSDSDLVIEDEGTTCSAKESSEMDSEVKEQQDSAESLEMKIEFESSIGESNESVKEEQVEGIEDTLGTSFSTDEAIDFDTEKDSTTAAQCVTGSIVDSVSDAIENNSADEEIICHKEFEEKAPSFVHESMQSAMPTCNSNLTKDWININGENFHRIQETSSAKNDSAFQLAESILGVIESNLPSNQNSSSLSFNQMAGLRAHTSSLGEPLMPYMHHATQQLMQNNETDIPQDKMLDFLAGLSTTSAIPNYNAMSSSPVRSETQTHSKPILDVDFTESETLDENVTDAVESDQPPGPDLTQPEEQIIRDEFESKEQPTAELYAFKQEHAVCPPSSSESTEAENLSTTTAEGSSACNAMLDNDHLQTEVNQQFSPDEAEADDEEPKPAPKGPGRGPKKRRARRPRFTRPSRKGAQAAAKLKVDNSMSDAEPPELRAASETVVRPFVVEYKPPDPIIEETITVKCEEQSDTPKELPPLPRYNSSTSSGSCTSLPETPTPTSPVCTTMHPKERLKRQLRAMAAEQSKNAEVSTPPLLSASSSNSSSIITPVPPEETKIQPVAPVNLLTNIKSEQLTAQSPVVFSFNESSYQPPSQKVVMKTELSSPIFERLALPTTITQDPLQSAATVIKRVAAPTNESLRLFSSGHRALPAISQELSLERDKRRTELKTLTALSDAEIDNVEACIESVLQDNSILVKRFRCTADIEANFIDEEIRENVDMLETNIEELTNFRHFGKMRKRNNAGLLNLSSAASHGTVGRPCYNSINASGSDVGQRAMINSLTSVRSNTPSSSHMTSNQDEKDSRSYLSSIESVIMRHSEGSNAGRKHSSQVMEDVQNSGHPSPDIVQPSASKAYTKHILSMAHSACGEVSNAKEPRLSGSITNSDYSTPGRPSSAGRNTSPTAVVTSGFQHGKTGASTSPASNAFSSKGLIGMPLPFESANPLLQNIHTNTALAAAAANSSLLRSSAEAFRIEHAANSLLSGATSAANSSSTSSGTVSNSGGGGGGGDMHININLMAHYPAYHPDILPALYANANQSAPTRLVTLQIPSAPVDHEGIESQVFVSRISTLFSLFNVSIPT